MNCAWKELLSVLPSWIAAEVDMRCKETLQELRLRLNQPLQLLCSNEQLWIGRNVTADDLNFCINTASRYSPWASQSISQGYITAVGGHRIGVCGAVALHGNTVSTVRSVRSLCIRVARDFPGIAAQFRSLSGSVLIIGPPGSGKTTLLRDLLRQLPRHETVCVIDEREELFPDCFCGERGSLDVLSGCPKPTAIDMLLRTMRPDTIGLDEITAESDCDALRLASWCGVRLIATAHASSISDLENRALYKPLIHDGFFPYILTIHTDKTVHQERIRL